MPAQDLSPLALALGRIPTGLYVVTTTDGDAPVGFVGSLLMQVGFEPPTVCVAIAHGRAHLDLIRSSGRFAVSILDAGSQGVMGAFFKRYEEGDGPFEHIEHTPAPSGSPVLPEALAWFDCKLSGEHDAGDHVVLFGEVTEGAPGHPGDPAVHLRANGLAY